MVLLAEPQDNPVPSFDPERIADALSRERLSKYLARSSGDLQQALALYVWNQEVGAALTVVVSQVEVCLRNRVAEALAGAFGTGWPRDARLRHNHADVRKELEKAESRQQ